jgi:hypothetical protein
MKELENKSILTHGSEHLAEAIQRKLFELGGDWRVGKSQALRNLNAAYYVMDDTYITCGKDINSDSFRERSILPLEELFAMSPTPKETVKIGDVVYDKAEFEAATKNLKPVK